MRRNLGGGLHMEEIVPHRSGSCSGQSPRGAFDEGRRFETSPGPCDRQIAGLVQQRLNRNSIPNYTGCDADNGGITLPAGFCASVFADQLGHARHIAVSPNGDVYVNTWSTNYNNRTNAPGGYIVALRDTDRDGHAETIQRFGTTHKDGWHGGGTGIAVHRGSLYVEVDSRIVRYALAADVLAPTGPA